MLKPATHPHCVKVARPAESRLGNAGGYNLHFGLLPSLDLFHNAKLTDSLCCPHQLSSSSSTHSLQDIEPQPDVEGNCGDRVTIQLRS